MPESKVYDLFIAGAGPAGTAATLRARELGLQVILTDMDDVMARVRDYGPVLSENTEDIHADRFPKGGEWIDGLRFTPAELPTLVAAYKKLIAVSGAACRIGLELTGIRRRLDGSYELTCWDHTIREERTKHARFVLLTLGRGMPYCLDIPGDTGDIARQLLHAGAFTGRPVCVLGAGTTAAETVIAVSRAKRASGDAGKVYWSHRGAHLPRIPKALSETFYEAYVGNGNIAFLHGSEPLAVLHPVRGEKLLLLRTDLRFMEGRPNEGAYMEFPVGDVIACLGEEIPETLLKALGIPLVNGGAGNRRRLVVTPEGETVRPGIFLAGSLLCPGYLEARDFEDDPAGFLERERPDGIIEALHGGVAVAEVIGARLSGEISLDTPGTSPVAVASTGTDAGELRLVRVSQTGARGEVFTLQTGGATTLGRRGCDINFADDDQLSDHHATVVRLNKGYVLRDENSWTGVFCRLAPAAATPVKEGSLLRLGRQFLLLGEEAGGYIVSHYDNQGQEKGRYPLRERALVFGSDAPNTLSSNDNTLSGRHLVIFSKESGMVVRDLDSESGSYLRVLGQMDLQHGDCFTIGNQSLMFLEHREPIEEQEVEPEGVPVKTGDPSITFSGTGVTIPVTAGRYILDVAQENNIWIRSECKSGVCGSDPLRIVSGGEYLYPPPGETEKETLEALCGQDSKTCRLACRCRIYGPVVVELIDS
ncbi:MAG: FHA domain-containing protein [Acidobacteriota bacterium]|nr:FHA domain-containing protein [Acidobacteriota bacterium]